MKYPPNYKRVSLSYEGVQSMTHQSERTLADIKSIIRQGVPPVTKQMHFCDFDDALSYQEMRDSVARTDESFSMLPAHLRDAFANDPANMLNALADPDQLRQMIDSGLIEDMRQAGFDLGIPKPEDAGDDPRQLDWVEESERVRKIPPTGSTDKSDKSNKSDKQNKDS